MKRSYHVNQINEDFLYKLVLGLIVPRPIGWISTVSKEGIYNIAPFSFFNAVCDEPPVFIISASDRDDGSMKDTVKNILETKEFAVNLVTEELLLPMKKTGEEFPPHVDEFKEAGLTPSEGLNIKAPLIKESPVNVECKLLDYKKVYDMHILFGEAICFHIENGIIDDKFRVDYNRLRPVGRLVGDLYVKVFGESLIKI